MFEKLMFLIYYPVFERQYTPPGDRQFVDYVAQPQSNKLIIMILVGIVLVILVLVLINKLIRKR